MTLTFIVPIIVKTPSRKHLELPAKGFPEGLCQRQTCDTKELAISGFACTFGRERVRWIFPAWSPGSPWEIEF